MKLELFLAASGVLVTLCPILVAADGIPATPGELEVERRFRTIDDLELSSRDDAELDFQAREPFIGALIGGISSIGSAIGKAVAARKAKKAAQRADPNWRAQEQKKKDDKKRSQEDKKRKKEEKKRNKKKRSFDEEDDISSRELDDEDLFLAREIFGEVLGEVLERRGMSGFLEEDIDELFSRAMTNTWDDLD